MMNSLYGLKRLDLSDGCFFRMGAGCYRCFDMKLIVTGTRNGRDDVEDLLYQWSEEHGYPKEMLLGGARGVDEQAARWANDNAIDHRVFPANWELHGKSAGPKRNARMVQCASPDDWCLAFPDKDSRGTWNCVGLARKAGLHVQVYDY